METTVAPKGAIPNDRVSSEHPFLTVLFLGPIRGHSNRMLNIYQCAVTCTACVKYIGFHVRRLKYQNQLRLRNAVSCHASDDIITLSLFIVHDCQLD